MINADQLQHGFNIVLYIIKVLQVDNKFKHVWVFSSKEIILEIVESLFPYFLLLLDFLTSFEQLNALLWIR